MVVGVYRNTRVTKTYFKLVFNDPVEIQIRHLKPAALVYTNDLSQAIKAIESDIDGPKVELIKNGRDITVGDVLKLNNRFWIIGIDEFLPLGQLPGTKTLAPLTIYNLVLENDIEVGQKFHDGRRLWQVTEKDSDGAPFTVKAFQINDFDCHGTNPIFYIIPIVISVAVGLFIYFDNGSNHEPATNEIDPNELLFQKALTEASEEEK